MKSEPDVFSIDDLKHVRTTLWDGVRNYQARNFMMNEMKVGDEILFYHSNAEPPGVAGLARVVEAAVPDPAQFDHKSEYHDSKATLEKPVWFCVRVGFVEKFKHLVSLQEIRETPKLAEMLVLRKGQRLSIQPVTAPEFRQICKMGKTGNTGKTGKMGPA